MIFEEYNMQNKLNTITRTLCATVLLAFPLAVAAVDYAVLGGSFHMREGSSGILVTPLPVPLVGMGTEAALPGIPLVGMFSDSSFPADFSCGDYGESASHVSNCSNASSGSKTPGGPHTSASRTGFGTFLFLGSPVFTYFATEGVDGMPNPHPLPAINLGTMRADFGSFYANWSTSEFNQGSLDPGNPPRKWDSDPGPGIVLVDDPFSTDGIITDNSDGSYTVTWQSLINGAPFEGFVGTWTMRICTPIPCVLIPPATAPTLEATQAAAVTRTLVQGGVGGATINFDAGFDTTGITWLWDSTDDSLDGGANLNPDAPLVIAQGFIDAAIPGSIHRVIATVTDTNVIPNARAAGEILLRIVAAGGADPDTDNNGIPDSADSITDVTMLQSDNTTETAFIITTSAGSLKLGTTAFCADPTSASITSSDITAFGGISCAVTTNAVDTTGTVVTGIGGYFDFEVHGLTRGQTVDVIIPLKQPLPVNAGYRKYTAVRGWSSFDQSTGDTMMSAAGTPGTCPAIISSEWVSGLIEGYNCMKMSITDGGPNDADGGADGIIKDPGSISSNPEIDTSLLDLGGSLSWPLLAALATWLGLMRRKARH